MIGYILLTLVYTLALLYVRKKYKGKIVKASLTEVNALLSDILEVNFRNSSLANSAQSILLVLKRFYNADYVTILLYNEKSAKLSVIASNVSTDYIQLLEEYSTGLIRAGVKKPKVTHSEGGSLTYHSAMTRGICFSMFTPLKHDGHLIGAILIENKDSDTSTSDHTRGVLYGKVFNSTALVLQNVIHTENLISMTSTDQLTGVHNRRFIDMTLGEQVSIHGNLGMSFSVALFDIDHFKKFNDTYGHQFGDIILHDVAQFVASQLEEGDWIARYGGEEFVIFFNRTSPHIALSKVDEIRQGIENLVIKDKETMASVTASFGFASYPADGLKANDLVERADKALYESKRGGRNRVTVYTPERKKPLEIVG